MELNDYDIEREEYKTLKLSEKEIEALKRVLAKEIFSYKPKKEDEITNENFAEEALKLQINRVCKNILTILRYLDR